MEEIQEIERLVKDGLVVDVNGQKYSATELKQIYDNRKVKCLNVKTLTGFVDFIKSKTEDTTGFLIIIEDFDSVSLITPVDHNSKNREVYIRAGLREENKFRFGDFMESEDFIIKLNSLFVDTYDRGALVKFVSSLTINNSIQSSDDGVTQSVVIKKGMSGALKDMASAPSVIELAPFRTFREIDQPKSSLLFRMKAYEQKIPTCALFEADGGEWKNKAIVEIKKYLQDQNLGLEIIA